jgi:hypothetical protein
MSEYVAEAGFARAREAFAQAEEWLAGPEAAGLRLARVTGPDGICRTRARPGTAGPWPASSGWWRCPGSRTGRRGRRPCTRRMRS